MTPDQLARVLRDLPETAMLTLPVSELRGLLPARAVAKGLVLPERDLTFAEVQAHYGISSRTLARWRQEGRFDGAHRQGQRWRYPPSSLVACDEWMAQDRGAAYRPGPAVDGRPLSREEVEALTSWRHVRRAEPDDDP